MWPRGRRVCRGQDVTLWGRGPRSRERARSRLGCFGVGAPDVGAPVLRSDLAAALAFLLVPSPSRSKTQGRQGPAPGVDRSWPDTLAPSLWALAPCGGVRRLEPPCPEGCWAAPGSTQDSVRWAGPLGASTFDRWVRPWSQEPRHTHQDPAVCPQGWGLGWRLPGSPRFRLPPLQLPLTQRRRAGQTAPGPGQQQPWSWRPPVPRLCPRVSASLPAWPSTWAALAQVLFYPDRPVLAAEEPEAWGLIWARGRGHSEARPHEAPASRSVLGRPHRLGNALSPAVCKISSRADYSS